MSKVLTNAVLTNSTLTFSIPRLGGNPQFYSIEVKDLRDVIEQSYANNILAVWAVPGSHWKLAPSHFNGLGVDYDVKISTTTTRDRVVLVKGAVLHRRQGSYNETRNLTLTFPELSAWEWPAGVTPLDMLYAFSYLEDVLKLPGNLHHNPGIQGRLVMEQCNSVHSRPEWIKAPTFDLTKLNRSLGFDFSYKRDLAAADLPEGSRIIVVDRNSQHIAAAQYALLGEGNPVYISPDALAGNYRETVHTYYNGRMPGFWRIEYDPLDMAYPFNPLYAGQEWVTTPLLKLLYSLNVPFRICEGYVWERYHKTLEHTAIRLWEARQALKADNILYPNDGGRTLAYDSIKRISTAFIGMFANAEVARFKPQFYRPDWRAIVIEEAKCRMIYSLLKLFHASGILPIAGVVDAVYFVVNTVEDTKLLLNHFDRPDALGGWKLAYDVPLTPELKQAILQAPTPAGIARAVKLAAADLAGVQ